MADSAALTQLRIKVSSLQSQLSQKQKALLQYQTFQSQADTKIKAMNKMHSEKVKNLLNSIQVLKKEKASIEGLSKDHKRSKLIEQLNKEILDQDIVIETMRSFIKQNNYEKQACDQLIVKTLKKGPERIRPESREQLRMEIDRLKNINLSLQGKFKGKGKGDNAKNKVSGQQAQVDDVSQISSISERSFVNQNDELLKKMRQMQFENENMKLEVNAKLKIIEKLKIDLKETDTLKTELEVLRNQVDISKKKVSTYERLMKESKESTNAKIVQLYEREIKIEEIQMVSRENRDKLLHAQETHKLLLEQFKVEKEQLQAQIEELKGENEKLIIENISSKKRMDEMKSIAKGLEDLHGKQKQDLKAKIMAFEQEIQKVVTDNKKYNEAYRNAETTLFEERAQWVQKQNELLEELKLTRENKANAELINKYVDDIQTLSRQNKQLKDLLESGGSGTGSNDKILLARIDAFEQKIKFLESDGKGKGSEGFNQIYEKYHDLLNRYDKLEKQLLALKQKYGPKNKNNRKQFISLTQRQKSEYQVMSSDVSRLNLQDIDSDLLDNFDSSLEYEFIINENGQTVKMPKLTEADRELLKLMTSDLWNFVQDDKMEKNIQKAFNFGDEDGEKVSKFKNLSKGGNANNEGISDDSEVQIDFAEIRRLKNMSKPRGTKVVMYEQELDKLNDMSDSVSITSAMAKQLQKFDSDVNIEFKRLPKGSTSKPFNTYDIQNVSVSVSGLDDSSASSAMTGQSNLGKKKKKTEEKGSRIQPKKIQNSQLNSSLNSSDLQKSSIGSALLDSDVSSDGIRQSQLAMINSDVEMDFKRKK